MFQSGAATGRNEPRPPAELGGVAGRLQRPQTLSRTLERTGWRAQRRPDLPIFAQLA